MCYSIKKANSSSKYKIPSSTESLLRRYFNKAGVGPFTNELRERERERESIGKQ